MPVVFQRIWIQLTSDRKRFAALCAMIVAGLLLWSRIILISNIPRTAVAGETAATAGLKASGDGSLAAGPGRGADNSKPIARIELWRAPIRDPFLINPSFFPKSNEPEQITPVPDKLLTQDAEVPAAAAARATRQANVYRLTAVMSAQELAVINERVYRKGDEIAPPRDLKESVLAKFTLMEVRDTSVEIQTEANGSVFKFVLKLNQPGQH